MKRETKAPSSFISYNEPISISDDEDERPYNK